MAFLISETGRELLADAERFCVRFADGDSFKWDRKEASPKEAKQTLRGLGYQTLLIPETYGGPQVSALDAAAVTERIAQSDAGLALMLVGNMLALKAVLAGGTEEQKQKVCRILLDGGIGAFCLTESQAGSDVSDLKTTAVPDGDEYYLLNGTKIFVTNGAEADFYCVAAVTQGQQTPSLFLVEKGQDGMTAGPEEEKLGARSASHCQIVFDNCRVGKEQLLGGSGGEGKGMKAVLSALNASRLFAAAAACGVGERALKEASAYAKERVQFGKPIIEHQAIRFKLADMKIKLEAARQLTSYGLTLLDQGEPFFDTAAMAKAFAADTAVEVSGSAAEIFGGYGYIAGYPAEKLLRDARAFQIIEGTGEMQRNTVAKVIADQK